MSKFTEEQIFDIISERLQKTGMGKATPKDIQKIVDKVKNMSIDELAAIGLEKVKEEPMYADMLKTKLDKHS